MKKWLDKLLSSDGEQSTKRVVFIALTLVHIISLFLLMYFKIEIANKSLVEQCLDWNSWLIIATGGLVGLEPVLSKWRPGGPKNIVQQDVKEQTVINEGEVK